MDEKPQTGNGKIAQLKEWECYFNFTKQGHKFIINEIYNIPKPKEDLRTYGNNAALYIEEIEKLILDLLGQDRNNGQLFLSRNKLLQELKMINQNYTYYRNKHLNLSKFTNISIEEINDFYESSNTTLKSNLETALRRLQKQSLIYWTYALTVCYIDTRIQRTDTGAIKATKHEYINDKGEKVLTFDTVKPIQELSYRKATKEEISIILEIERNLLKEYNCKDKSQLYKIGKINEYYNKVKDQLFDRTNIIFYYNSYEITFNDEHVQDRLKELKLEELEREVNQNYLNKGIREKLEEKAINKHESAILKCIDPLEEDKKNFRSLNTYIHNQNKLSDTLINKSYKVIRE